jgi:hypothetical protein
VPEDAGIFDWPPALQAAIASAATSGATNFNDPFIHAPFVCNVGLGWEHLERDPLVAC